MKVIKLYGTIGYDWWSGGGITAASFAREFEAALASGEEIQVRINSPGGDVLEGIAIYNTIAVNNDRVTTIVDGIAYSMGAVIAMAGKNRHALKNATIMIHNVSGCTCGNANDFKGALEMIEKLDNALVESIAQLTGLKTSDVKANWFDYRDHTLSAKEALDAKLITEIIDLNGEDIPVNLSNLSQQELFAYYNKFTNTDKEPGFLNKILSVFRNGSNPLFPAPPQVISENSTDMKIKATLKMAAILAAAGVTAKEGEEFDLTAEHLEKVEAKLTSEAQARQTAESAKTTAEANLTTMTTERDTWKGKFEGKAISEPSNVNGKEGDTKEGEAEYDWTKSTTGHARFANQALGS